MVDDPLDNVDRAILFELQRNARNNTNADIAGRIDVSASTVGKRIAQLETEGVLRGYDPDIDYERAGFPLQVLFICTVSITEREALIEEALEIDTVVNVREMMTDEGDDRDVYEAIDTHQAETADSHSEHFVNFQARLTESETAQP